MTMLKTRTLIDKLYLVDGKAEIINGEIVHFMATGRMPSYAAFRIASSLFDYVEVAGLPGIALPDNAGFHVDLPNRESFSPDAFYYEGPYSGMKFFEGAPRFAAEVRSEGDYGPVAEMDMAAKRGDYFAAGTEVVWDVDLLHEEVVRKYTPASPNVPTVYRRGEMAEAEPAVSGWKMPVDTLFERKRTP